jgi:hypothetical protein
MMMLGSLGRQSVSDVGDTSFLGFGNNNVNNRSQILKDLNQQMLIEEDEDF